MGSTPLDPAVMKRHLRHVLWHASPGLYRRTVQSTPRQRFSIGIYGGHSPLALTPLPGVTNPVITHADVTDVPATFVADPFLQYCDGRWHLLFEVMNGISRLGQIAAASSADGRTWTYDRVVLKEPFHLAYPHVFEWDGAMYMVPDTPDRGIRLYRSERFPYDWKLVTQISSDRTFSDSSLFEFDGRWWMYTGWTANRMSPMQLRLFHATTPLGPWQEHPGSPISSDPRLCRPAGRVQIVDGRPYRFAQSGVQRYGECVHTLRVDVLEQDRYRECELSSSPMLAGGNESWNADGMHHVDSARTTDGAWLACVDGWYAPSCQE